MDGKGAAEQPFLVNHKYIFHVRNQAARFRTGATDNIAATIEDVMSENS